MYSGKPIENPAPGRQMPGSTKEPVPVIRLYGITREGYRYLPIVLSFFCEE